MIDKNLLKKMDSGVIYDPAVSVLQEEQKKRLVLLREYNNLSPDDTDGKEKFLKRMFASVGDSVYIEQPFYANWAGMKVKLGSNVYINFLCTFVDDAPITIGNNVMIGPRVTLATATHPISPALRHKGLQMNSPIVIEDDVWLASSVFVGPGVTIGRGSVIGAGSVVLHDIPPFSVACGVPARVVRAISPEEMKDYRAESL